MLKKTMLLTCLTAAPLCATDNSKPTQEPAPKKALVVASSKERTPLQAFQDALKIMDKYADKMNAFDHAELAWGPLNDALGVFYATEALAKQRLTALQNDTSSEQCIALKDQLKTAHNRVDISGVALYLDLRKLGIDGKEAWQRVVKCNEEAAAETDRLLAQWAREDAKAEIS